MRRFLFLVGLVFVMSGVLALSNPSSNWQANQPTFEKLYAGDFENYWPILKGMKDGQCNATTDFIIGIPPGGCSPMVVRSDLLAEQNVPVFCQLYAIKVNPLIKVSSIKSISFKGDYPEGVRSVVYHPARAAIKSYSTLLGSSTLENIGYVVIILKQEKVEADMAEWVAGNLTATMRYDAEEAYGTGRGDYYLEPVGDEEWGRNYMASSFWKGRGFLRVSDIEDGRAKIQVMGDRDNILRTLTLKVGETSSSSYLPGFYCKAGLKVKLTSITTQEDMARLNVDGNDIWVRKGGKFLNGKCRVRSLVVLGNNDGTVGISCSGTSGTKVISLKGVVIRLRDKNGTEAKEYNIGDKFGDRYVVGYGEIVESEEGFVILASSALKSSDLNRILTLWQSSSSFVGLKKKVEDLKGISDLEVFDVGDVRFVGMGIEVKGDGDENVYFDRSVDIVEDELVADYGSEEKEIGGTWAEEALYEEIELAGKLGKHVTQKRLMNLFLDEYPLAKTADYVRDMRAKMEGTDYSKSFVSLYVGDDFRSISVVDFKAVGEGERQVDLRVGNSPENNLSEIGKDEFVDGDNGVDLNNDRRIEVKEILPGKVRVYFKNEGKDVKRDARSRGEWIKEGDSEVFDGVRVYVENVKVNEVAHVSLIPDVKHEKSEADFTFRIGIEKRAIELSPERANRMIKNLNASIKEWENIVERLGSVVAGLKGVCFATSAVLMIKNLVDGASGEAAARTKVMKEYKKICDSDYPEMTRTECYNKLEGNISRSVDAMVEYLSGANKDVEEAQAEAREEEGAEEPSFFERLFGGGGSVGGTADSGSADVVGLDLDSKEGAPVGEVLPDGSIVPEESTGAISGSCANQIGNRVIQIAREVKKEKGVSDDSLRGTADCFEHLALMIVAQESGFRHCKSGVSGCFDCGERENVLEGGGGGDFGVMQINKGVHSNANYWDFDENVRYALEKVLIDWGYSQYKDSGVTHNGIKYEGWQAALRAYNGLGSGGDDDYVNNVLRYKAVIKRSFPNVCMGERSDEAGGSNAIIIIDAGHGGTDPGAVYGVNEKDINLDIALKLGALLGSRYDVRFTRSGDETVSISARREFANNIKNENPGVKTYFVSIHANAVAGSCTSARGAEVLYYGGGAFSGESREFAFSIVSGLGSMFVNRGVKERSDLGVLKVDMPAVLIEVGFLCNEADRAKLTGRQEEIVGYIFGGTDSYVV